MTLSKHAWAYPPGFVADAAGHRGARLTRATSSICTVACWSARAQLSEERGGGSLTALPFIETLLGDVAAYVPTNVISITDGQIYLLSDLFYAGQRPAMDVGISVSRVGGDAQTTAMKRVAGRLKLDLAQFASLAAFAQFGSGLDRATQQQLDRGLRLTELLKQPQYQPLRVADQVALIYAGTNGLLDEVPVESVGAWKEAFLRSWGTNHAELSNGIQADPESWSDEVAAGGSSLDWTSTRAGTRAEATGGEYRWRLPGKIQKRIRSVRNIFANYPRAGGGLRIPRASRPGARAGQPRLRGESLGSCCCTCRPVAQAAPVMHPLEEERSEDPQHHGRAHHLRPRPGGRIQRQHHPCGATLRGATGNAGAICHHWPQGARCAGARRPAR